MCSVKGGWLVLQVARSGRRHVRGLLLDQNLPHLLRRLPAPQQQRLVTGVQRLVFELKPELVEADHELLDHESHLIYFVISFLDLVMELHCLLLPAFRPQRSSRLHHLPNDLRIPEI